MWTTLNNLHKLNSSSTVITWSPIGSRFSLSATWVTCDSLSFKNTYLITTMKSCLTRFTTRNYFLLNFKGNYHVQRTVPGIPVMNKKHSIKIPHLSILIQNLYYIQISMGTAQSVQWLVYTLEDLPFKSLQKQESYLFCKTRRQAPAPTQPPTQWKPVLYLWQ